ncbi:MAG: ISAzo13 family transposase, partial [Proteobacteria bacterium]|nr:ISAzo13 family transposase [Pseudomonadota bacterium]
MKTEAQIRRQYEQIKGTLHERARREWAGSEAMALGRGGIAEVHRATGMAPSTIGKGVRELCARETEAVVSPVQRVRRSGGGRKKKVDQNPQLLSALESLVEPATRGDPESPLRWTVKSLRRLSEELRQMGHEVSRNVVSRVLRSLGYSLQANSKQLEGSHHPDRNAQFEHINRRSAQQLAEGNPVISVDTKKKELVGSFKNAGREVRPKGSPEQVQVHDFIDRERGKANPYGVYDIGDNSGWVSVGISSDTAAFAVESIRRWWKASGAERYATASELLITADCGGSNGYRTRLWKYELQQLADELGLPIAVCHLPPGTSKWNKIEHRLFSFISMNWRGKPLVSHQTIINLISATRTHKGLTVQCELDDNEYDKGRKITDAQMASLSIKRDSFHGEWNYTLYPSSQTLA